MDQHHEIERKFLVAELPPNLHTFRKTKIVQGYISVETKGVVVRLRQRGRKYSLTAKRGRGVLREEREIKLSAKQFEMLWPMSARRRLCKTRYEVPLDNGLVAEIDIYGGANEGVITTEVEFPDQARCKAFKPPAWFGKDVSGKKAYSNLELARE